eukprot:7647109-Karenia_brevis.AAC.1
MGMDMDVDMDLNMDMYMNMDKAMIIIQFCWRFACLRVGFLMTWPNNPRHGPAFIPTECSDPELGNKMWS